MALESEQKRQMLEGSGHLEEGKYTEQVSSIFIF